MNLLTIMYRLMIDPEVFIASIEVLISQVLRNSSKDWPILIPQELVGDHSCAG